MKYSVIMNVYNEEKNLEYALKSLKYLKNYDELLIADMGSSDKTVEIAKKYNAKVINIPYDKYFDRGRKVIIENAKNEWCFLLDADELITKSLGKTIEKIVEKSDCDAVYFPTINYFFGVKSEYGLHYPCHHCRLFKKNVVTVTGIPHNYFNINKECIEKFVYGEENAIIHFSFNNIEEWMKKIYRYIDLEEKNNKFNNPFICGIKSFCKAFFKEKNYQGGYEGLILSILSSISAQLANIKLYYDDKEIDAKKIKEKYLDEWKYACY